MISSKTLSTTNTPVLLPTHYVYFSSLSWLSKAVKCVFFFLKCSRRPTLAFVVGRTLFNVE